MKGKEKCNIIEWTIVVFASIAIGILTFLVTHFVTKKIKKEAMEKKHSL